MENGLKNKYYLGIQVNLSEINVSDKMVARLNYLTNNLGDCYLEEDCPLPNTMDEERQAVEKVAHVLDLTKEECWGYVGEGSSLGNLQGMWMGSLIVDNATFVFSDSAHYSIFKFAASLKFNKVKVIKSHLNGEIDLEDLDQQIEKNEKVVMVLTAGTTMTSAYDPVEDCLNILKSKSCEFYFHLDAALGGMIVPFLSEQQFPSKNDFTFKNKDISSMTVSMHKVLGSPMPANIFLARQQVVKDFKNKANTISYFNNMDDITVYGSRDGFRASVINELLQDLNHEIMNNRLTVNLGKVEKMVFNLKCMGIEDAFCQEGGLAVVIPLNTFAKIFNQQHQKQLIEKYKLVKSNTLLHIYIMDHVSDSICDELISDFKMLKEQNEYLEVV
ncbi:aminotransferase class V-fold PLP-dependent enzyme [Apibacter sp. HY039]|uniref:aminotransferase class V-fold PLP-dependent enzyme n=1 Tax=Apibacter sp. HY039 TaxID=2501476 RepID=UPI000FEC11A8|nr:aminotransferase class V-fold PLP-dependent enzyme [Apibacter sp. HY039]